MTSQIPTFQEIYCRSYWTETGLSSPILNKNGTFSYTSPLGFHFNKSIGMVPVQWQRVRKCSL